MCGFKGAEHCETKHCVCVVGQAADWLRTERGFVLNGEPRLSARSRREDRARPTGLCAETFCLFKLEAEICGWDLLDVSSAGLVGHSGASLDWKCLEGWDEVCGTALLTFTVILYLCYHTTEHGQSRTLGHPVIIYFEYMLNKKTCMTLFHLRNNTYFDKCLFFFFCLYNESQWSPTFIGYQHSTKYVLQKKERYTGLESG